MVKTQKSVNIELQINMASIREKRTAAKTSTRRDKKKSNKSKEDDEVLYVPNTANEFGASSSRLAPDEKGQDCCELNEIVMNRLSQIKFKHQELERNQAHIIYLHNDLKKEMTNLNRNVQGMFAEFLNQFGKETGGSFYNVLDRQIVLYTGDTSLGRKLPFEDVIGSRAEDVEVGREVQFDRKDKRVQINKSNNESGTEFEGGGEEPKKYLFEGKFDVDANDDHILVDDSTPDIPRKSFKKAAAVFRSPYTSNFGSSAKSKVIVPEIRTGTYALSDELNAGAIDDVVDFEEWYILGLSKKNKASSVVDRSPYNGKDPLDQLTVNILDSIPQQQQSDDCGIYVIKYAEYFVHQKIEEMTMTFKHDEARLSLAIQFYKYAKKILDEGYETDIERASDRVNRV
ncbi:Ulp1 protease family [Abeliophyllum distichum]|uniref:Ulp1 protease family n=1 Tax=Abeliophyllum distichum TaxID=126358 RepID=A0ABD1QAB2_9LAMI